MARMTKPLLVLNDTLVVAIPGGAPSALGNGTVGVQYGTKGDDDATNATGTVVIEDTIDEVTWYPLKINLNDETQVDLLAAAGKGWVAVNGSVKVRARMSVAGGAHGVKVTLNYLTP